MPKQSKPIRIYTDGAASPNPGPGGYGVVIVEPHQIREYSAGYRLTTNNRMEMMALIIGLTYTNPTQAATIYSDSRYLLDGLSSWVHNWQANGWRTSAGKDVLNRDLWEKLYQLIQGRQLYFSWVKGHSGNSHNERCDNLANNVNHTLVDEVYEGLK